MPTKVGVTAVFAVLQASACRPPVNLDPATAASTWTLILGDVDDNDLMQAVLAYVRGSSPFWPTPGQLLAMVPRRAVAAIDDADAAWGALFRQMGRHGSYDPPALTGDAPPTATKRAVMRGGEVVVVEFPAPKRPQWFLSDDVNARLALEAGLAAVGGWRVLCALEHEAIPAARASFRAAYRAQRDRAGIETESLAILHRIEDMRQKRLTGSK